MNGDSTKPLRLLVVAGEASGDAHAASLIRAVQALAPHTAFEFFGATGQQMRAAGVDSIIRADELSILGLWEIGRALGKFWDAFGKLKQAATEKQPTAAILVDWPDFNLRLARWLHRRGIRVIYYVSPQLWAWRSHRARNIKRDVDLLISILPFETAWYAKRGMTHVKYVGHPLVGEVQPRFDRDQFCRRHDLDPSRPIVALLPGSRHKEFVRILPPMLAAAEIVSGTSPQIQLVVAIAPNRDPMEAEEIIRANGNGQITTRCLRVVHQETREALAAADAAAVASGTATLEAALLGTPLVVVYKESPLNWHVLGSLITADHYGLVNLIAERRVAVELIQNDLNGEALAKELLSLLEPSRNLSMRAELGKVAARLGESGASRRAAEVVLEAIGVCGNSNL